MSTATHNIEMKKTVTPQLRFPEFNGDWETKKLVEWGLKVIDGDRGTNYPNGDDFSSEGYCLFMNAKNVTKNGLSFDTKMFITKEKDEKLRKGKLKRNDLILTTRGSVGNIGYYDNSIQYEHLRINSGMVLLRSENSQIDSNFIYISFFTPKLNRIIDTISFGSAQPQLTVKEINLFKLNLPSLPEQTKIASFLTAVDEKLTALKKKKTLLEQYKKGVMQQIFSQELRFKDDNGNDFADWEEKKLGKITVEVKRDLKDKTDLTDIAVLTISSEKGFITQKERFSQVIAGNSLSKYTLLKKGQMSYNRGASKRFQYGCFNILKSYKEALVPNIYISFFFKENYISEFYDQLFSTGFANKELRKFISSSVRLDGLLNINRGDFFSVIVPVPVLEEQTKIANFLSRIDEKINHCQAQIEKVAVWKKGLLQQLFV